MHDYNTLRKRMIDIIKKYDSYAKYEFTPKLADKLKIPLNVLEAMERVPRHEFVPKSLKDVAYEDCPLQIGHEQTISQPYIVALMTAMLNINSNSKVLEIGTGSGYQAAVLSQIAKSVYTVEIIEELYKSSKEIFKKLAYKNIHSKCDDGRFGWKECSPYDGIIVTAASSSVPNALLEQLNLNATIVMPIGEAFGVQQLIVIKKDNKGKLIKQSTIDVRFVPITSKNK